MSSKTQFRFVLCALLGVAGLGCEEKSKKPESTGAASAAPAAPLSGDVPCPARFVDLPAAGQLADNQCLCGATAGGKVWGSGIYTPESAICAAAIHAGAVPREGGSVTIRAAQGCAAYAGSTNNAVSTLPGGRGQRSFYFPSVGDGKCGPVPQSQ